MLDKKNKIIIEHLLNDCRITTTKLSKITKLSQSAVVRRIQKLEKKEYILRYDALIDFNKFDLKLMVFMVSVLKEENKREEFEKYCLENKFVMSVFRQSHKMNYTVILFQINKEKEKIINYLEKNGFDYKYFKFDKTTFLPFSIFDEVKIPLKKLKLTKIKLNLDKIDIKILEVLMDGGGRDSILDIAKKTNLSFDLVLYRYKKLKKAGYFIHYLMQPNPQKFCIKYVFVVLETKNVDFNECVRGITSIRKGSFFGQINKNRYWTTLIIKDLEELKNTLDRIYDIFGVKIINIDTFLIKDWILINRVDLRNVI